MKYLFEAHFSDDSRIEQTQDDVSTVLPDKSAFYDVIQREQDLVAFGLFSDECPDTYAVNLTNGMFEINGLPFTVQDPSLPELPLNCKYRLIYFRKVRRDFTADLQAIGVSITFHIGWQTTVDGMNRQQTIAVL